MVSDHCSLVVALAAAAAPRPAANPPPGSHDPCLARFPTCPPAAELAEVAGAGWLADEGALAALINAVDQATCGVDLDATCPASCQLTGWAGRRHRWQLPQYLQGPLAQQAGCHRQTAETTTEAIFQLATACTARATSSKLCG